MKKKNLLANKAVLTAVCLACALSMSACGKKNNTNENKDPLTGQDMSQTNESSTEGGTDTAAAGDYSEFDTMIEDTNTNPNDIIGYINTNIVSAGVSDVERFFSGLLGFGDDIRNIDFTGLEDSRQYMPEDMIAFMDLMKLESDTPSMVMSNDENRRVINMTLSEMLERALLFEHHLEKYPNNVSTDAASRLYEEIATQAISGGYNKTEGISHYYKGDTEDTVDQEALQYYQQFAQANPDSNLGRIVSDYITVLQTNQFQINDSMEDFYRGLNERLDAKKLSNNNGTNNTGTGNNGTGTTGNGTGTTGNGTDNNGTNGTGTTGNGTDNNGTNGAGTAAGTAGGNADTVIEGTVSR